MVNQATVWVDRVLNINTMITGEEKMSAGVERVGFP